MAQGTIIQAKIIEHSAALFMARVVKSDGTPIVQADISTITCNTFDEDGVLIASPTISVSAVISNTLQKTAAWTIDSTGFNFSVLLDGSNWPTGGQTDRIEFKFTPVSGPAYYVLYDCKVLEVVSE